MPRFDSMSITELKTYIDSNGGELDDCLTKQNLIERAEDVRDAVALRDKTTQERLKKNESRQNKGSSTASSEGFASMMRSKIKRQGWRRLMAQYFPPFPGLPRTKQSVEDPTKRDYRDYPFDLSGFRSMSFSKRVGMFARAWAIQGNLQPAFVSLFYWLKTILYFILIWGIILPSLANEVAPNPLNEFARICAFSAAWEVLGLGCGTGPNSAKFIPPITSWWYFFTPGTALIPVLPSWGTAFRSCCRGRPKQDGLQEELNAQNDVHNEERRSNTKDLKRTTRTVMESSLYGAFLFCCISVVFDSDGPSSKDKMNRLMFTGVILSMRDATFASACRAEVYGSMLAVHAMRLNMGLTPQSELNALRGIQLAIWMWAGFSKLGPWWSYVLPVMNSCNPALSSTFLRPLKTEFYENWPVSVEPSRLAKIVSMGGAWMEILFPICLALGGQYFGRIGLLTAVGMHTFIIMQIPMGAPLEWNVFTMSAACSLFGGADPKIGLASIHSLLLSSTESTSKDSPFPGWHLLELNHAYVLYLGCFHVLLPLLGNLYPSKISFLFSSRYYAGNWATTLWLVKRDSLPKLNKLKTIGGFPHDQLAFLFGDDEEIENRGTENNNAATRLFDQFEYRVLVGRMMHLTSRALLKILPLIKDLDSYYIIEGELICGTVLGWSFGDGHLSGVELLKHVRSKCDFQKNELVHIEIESLSWWKGISEWTMRDSCEIEKPIAKGSITTEELMKLSL